MWLVCVPARNRGNVFFERNHERTRTNTKIFFYFSNRQGTKGKEEKHLCSSATSAAKNSRELPLALFSFLKNGFRCGDVDVSAPKSFS